MIEMTRMAWPRWIVMSALCACGGDDGGGTAGGTEGGTEGGTAGGTADGTADGSDESGGDLPPPGSDRDPNGDQCGGDVNGWQTTCLVDSVTAATSDMGPILGAPPVGASTGRFLCCEGRPTIETADHGCDGICQLEVCEAAKLAHMNRCESCGPFDCGFDMSNCLAGSPHDQLVLCAMPIQLPFSYTLTANCEASNNEVRNPDGSFHFLDQPVNDPMNDPPFCMPSSELGLDPPAGLGQFAGSASTGTKARVTWSLADADGEQQSEALDADFEYALVPCAGPAGECLQITSLVLTLPTTEALGMTIAKARLEVVSVAEAPSMQRGQSFQFGDETIGVLMQAHVNGVPLVLSGTNAGVPHGVLSPAGDQFSISDLRFEFEDSIITAALEIEVQGQYDARRPNAQITRLDAPASCAEPITLLATSWDDDQDPLVHSWWVRGVGAFQGPLVELVVPAGELEVVLTSSDPSGLFDTETLRYDRKCQ